MTAKTSDFSSLIYYNPAGPGFDAVESATLNLVNTGPINEGDQVNFEIITWGIPDGTTLYYRIVGLSNMNYNQFTDVNDSVVITNHRNTFSVGIFENHLTAAGTQTFDVVIEKTFGGGGEVTRIAGIVVNDTSQDPPGPSFNQVISLNPSYIPSNAGTSIPNEADEGSTSATVVGAFTSSSAQGGSITLTDTTTSAIYLPAKNIKTIGMWIKIIDQQAATQYLLDSRERDGPNAGNGTGYFYSSGFEGWSLMSINGNPADNSLWSTVANNTNVWQYVTLINQTNTPHSITLFNRHTLAEGLATIQVGWIEAWDYIQVDGQIAAAYATHSSNYV